MPALACLIRKAARCIIGRVEIILEAEMAERYSTPVVETDFL